MPITGQKVCGGGGGVVWWWWWWLKPILVFSLAQAEQYYFEEYQPHILGQIMVYF